MRNKTFLAACAAAAVAALPALAQQAAQPQPQPQPQAQPQPATEPATANSAAPAAASTPRRSRAARPAPADSLVETVGGLSFEMPPPPVEYPGWARRDPRTVGSLQPSTVGLGPQPWGSASGAFLTTLMRRMDTPIASRWAHIALRNGLLARTAAPRHVHPVDWVAERAWLLLRMGEADAARMLVGGVDVDRFTPKMVQVAVQSALASGDPAALCPLQDGIAQHDVRIRPLVQSMCSALAGEPEAASAQIAQARRSGRIGGIDLALAEKVVGAAGSGRAATIEWEPVDALTAWRFGLATGTGMAPPQRLLDRSSPRLAAFMARAPLIAPRERLPSAFVAAGLGVFSSQSLIDLYSAIYDTTDPSELANSDAWQLREAFVGDTPQERLGAIRKLLALSRDPLRKEAARAVAARAASLVEPSAELQQDAPELISAMLAGGYDRAAARWINAVEQMEEEPGDRAWAMLALAAPNIAEVGSGRITAFIRRDQSADRFRSGLLVAGLAGLGRISTDTANALNRRYGLGLGRSSSWTKMIDSAAGRGQGGTVLVMTGTGMQTSSYGKVPAAHLYHAIAGLTRTGQDFHARMIAAEALSRT